MKFTQPPTIDELQNGVPVEAVPAEVMAEPEPNSHYEQAQRAKTSGITFPPECLVGSLGEFAEVMSGGSEVPPEFFFAAGLTMVGAIAARSLTLNIRFAVEPRLYTVLLGESGRVKKSTAMKQSIEFFRSLHAPVQPWVSYGVASAEGLVSDLNRGPSGQLVLAYDELRALVDKCNIKGSTLLPAVTSLFEGTKWHNTTKNKRDSVACDDAHLSILGCCTSDTYKHIWSTQAIAIGLVNRLFVVLSDAGTSEPWPEEVPGQNLHAIRERIERQLARLQGGIKYARTDEAFELWKSWCETPRPSEHAKRLDTIGFRLLGLVALTTDKDVIDAETVDVVCRILDYELKVRMLTDPIDADGTVAKLESSVRKNLDVKGRLTYNQLRRAVNADKYGIWAYDRALENLMKVRDIALLGNEYVLNPTVE